MSLCLINSAPRHEDLRESRGIDIACLKKPVSLSNGIATDVFVKNDLILKYCLHEFQASYFCPTLTRASG